MERIYKFVMIVLVGAFILSGCAKPPTQEIDNAKAQVEAITNADTETYASDELGKLKSDLTAALDEVKIQDDKFLFKKFDNAKTMLAAVMTDSENVKAVAAQRKEEAKNKAIAAQDEAKAALETAKALLAQAPTGKGTKADIEMFKADLTGLEESLPALQQTIDQEKYSDAVNSANIIKEKAGSVSSQIQAAIDKVKSKKRK
jgi:PBP1b-binding outer membrane lipoprotein LpoB